MRGDDDVLCRAHPPSPSLPRKRESRFGLTSIGKNPAHPLLRAAEEKLRERLADLKTPPPDLRLSCFELQRTNDLAGSLQDIYAALGQGGLFLGVMAGGESLKELRVSLMEAEIELKGGASPRIHPMADLLTLSRLLPQAGFALPVADEERVTLTYPDLFALMRDLREMVLTNRLEARSRSFAPRRLFEKAAEIYAARFPAPDGKGIAATVDLLFLHGWKE